MAHWYSFGFTVVNCESLKEKRKPQERLLTSSSHLLNVNRSTIEFSGMSNSSFSLVNCSWHTCSFFHRSSEHVLGNSTVPTEISQKSTECKEKPFL
jgi:hypothetical protein